MSDSQVDLSALGISIGGAEACFCRLVNPAMSKYYVGFVYSMFTNGFCFKKYDSIGCGSR